MITGWHDREQDSLQTDMACHTGPGFYHAHSIIRKLSFLRGYSCVYASLGGGEAKVNLSSQSSGPVHPVFEAVSRTHPHHQSWLLFLMWGLNSDLYAYTASKHFPALKVTLKFFIPFKVNARIFSLHNESGF